MLRLILWPLGALMAWWFFLCGDIHSRLMNLAPDNQEWVEFWHPLYNYCMLRSCLIQDWFGGTQPWWPWEQ